MKNKICTGCKEEKPVSDYYIQRIGTKGQPVYVAACKICCSDKAKEKWSSLTKEGKLKHSRIARERMGEDYHKNYRLKQRYGITLEEYNSMLDSQNSLCYICETTFDEDNKAQVDHDHKTGKIRKLLCRNCNTAIGHMKEDIDVLKKSIKYIEEHSL